MHVFVAGPGVGEAIAVALPERGWLAFDGCRTGARFPLEAILKRWRRGVDDPLYAYLLTHPHSDHAAGVPQLIDTYSPQYIGVAATDPPSVSLLFEAAELGKRVRATVEALDADDVRAAVLAIERWHEEHPDGLLRLHDGVSIPLPGGDVSALVRAPAPKGLATFLAKRRLGPWLRRHANHISVVVEIGYGDARVVLGGDLPRYPAGGKQRPVPTGWNQVLKSHPHLGTHNLLKVPHHGSRKAQHPGLMTASADERAWCVTPYNRSRLPRLARGDGLALLLDAQPSICLTAVPASKSVQAPVPHPGHIHLSQLRTRIEVQRTGDPFLDRGIDIRPAACGPLDAVWCFAVDRGGALCGAWRGDVGLEVMRDPVDAEGPS
ncbi:MBL fold metallo-hydrolase [Haliangium sp.]|uniref:MBL fold metallo-hydrolase n=1 Tax=Haliangium sp. TaxID=2663208 RepID=UPI003D0DEF7B